MNKFMINISLLKNQEEFPLLLSNRLLFGLQSLLLNMYLYRL
jgi:hypothetical protein